MGKEPEEKNTPAHIVERNKKILLICAVISLISILVITVVTEKYMGLLASEKPLMGPFNDLRNALVDANQDPKFNNCDPLEVSAEVKQLTEKTQQAQIDYRQYKIDYKNHFYQQNVRRSGSWKSHGKSSYYFSKGEKNWYDAEDFCLSRGAHLASIHSQEEQTFITSQVYHTSWIGLTMDNKEGKWRWSDGSRLEEELWFGEEPGNGRRFWKPNQDCTVIEPTLLYYNWKVNNCHNLHRWVCKGNS